MKNIISTQLNRSKFNIKPCYNWRKEPIVKKEDFHTYNRDDPRMDKIMGYDFSYYASIVAEFNRMKLNQSVTIMFVGENQKAAILEAMHESNKRNKYNYYLALLQVDTDKYRATCISKLFIN